jgi:hypothetical protein
MEAEKRRVAARDFKRFLPGGVRTRQDIRGGKSGAREEWVLYKSAGIDSLCVIEGIRQK